MGCGASLPSWEVEHTKWWHMLTLDITWTDDTRTRVLGNAEGSVTVKLTITDTASGGSVPLLSLEGGWKSGGVSGHVVHTMDAVLRSPDGEQYATRTVTRTMPTMWSLGTLTRSGGGGGKYEAKWIRDKGANEGTLPAQVSVNFSGGIARAWRGEAPDYVVDSSSTANKKRRDDLLGFVTAAHIPKDADMGNYGFAKRATLMVEPTIIQQASKEELACFLAMLCDFYWTRGLDNWCAPKPKMHRGGGSGA